MKIQILLPTLALLIATLQIGAIRSSLADPPKRLLMGVMGDSISAATLADLPIPWASPAPPEEQIRRWAAQEKDPRFIFENKRTFSWASGRKISSHYLKLLNWLRRNGELRPLDVLNAAYPGNKSGDLDGQVKQIVKAMQSGKYAALKYVTLLIGANDACSTTTPSGVPPETVQANILSTLKQLSAIQQDEPIRVIVVGIPRIPDLATSAYRDASTIFGLSCETVRNKVLNFCNSLLLWNTPAQYEMEMQIIDDINRAIRLTVIQANAVYPNLDVVYSNRLYDLSIPLNVLAVDCFHPNWYGQSAISDQIWMDQPWFE